MVTFNPRKKNEKGIGHVDVDNTQSQPEETNNSSKTALYAIGGLSAIGLAAGAFMLVNSGGQDDAPSPFTPTPVPPAAQVEPAQPAVKPAPAPVVAPTPAQSHLPSYNELMRETIIAQQQAIYQSPVLQAEYSAYILGNGMEGERGGLFALHASLSYPGSVNILITEGDYAGIRVGFYPADINGTGGDGEVIVQRVGYTEITTTDTGAEYEVFRLLPEEDWITVSQNMETPARQGQPVELAADAPAFEKIVTENGQRLLAFSIIGEPETDGIFGVALFNEDLYTIDLNTGDFTVNSAFAYDPTYLETGRTINADDIPWVDGNIDLGAVLNFTPPAPTATTATTKTIAPAPRP